MNNGQYYTFIETRQFERAAAWLLDHPENAIAAVRSHLAGIAAAIAEDPRLLKRELRQIAAVIGSVRRTNQELAEELFAVDPFFSRWAREAQL